jgi:Prokaryotic N-terminal methylation motif
MTTSLASARRMRSQAGFTIVEMMIATMIMMTVTGAIFSMMNPAQGSFQMQPEVSDMQQRLRVGVDTLQKDLIMAGAGTYTGASAGALSFFVAPIMPYRSIGEDTDPSKGVFFREDAITLMYVPPTPAQTNISAPMPAQSSEIKVTDQPNCPSKKEALCGFDEGMRLIIFDPDGNWDTFTVTHVQDSAAHLQHRGQDFTVSYAAGSRVTQVKTATYYLKEDNVNKTYQLMYYDGWDTEAPVVENVVKLKFEYFGEPQPPELTGKPLTAAYGPWTTYGPKPVPLTESRNGWPAGQSCVFDVADGQHVPRLAELADNVSQVPLTKEMLSDGPWCPDAAKPNRFDADLLRVRRVRVTMRVQVGLAALRGPAGALFTKGGTASTDRMVPDQEISFDVTPRNLNLGR